MRLASDDTGRSPWRTTNDIAIVDISLGRAVAIDLFAGHRETGSFVIVDALSGATLAGGIVKAAREATADTDAAAFLLTAELLARGVCLGLDPGDAEFRRRAEEVAIILRAAGVVVETC